MTHSLLRLARACQSTDKAVFVCCRSAQSCSQQRSCAETFHPRPAHRRALVGLRVNAPAVDQQM